MTVNIKAGMEKVPGGLMLVPLLVGALIHTLAPDVGKFFGSFTGALFTGLAPILGVFYVCLGATLDVKATPYIAKKGGALLVKGTIGYEYIFSTFDQSVFLAHLGIGIRF